jgi:predicted PurR-regulated permease PerM
MTDLILFTLNAIVIYLVADWLVRLIEKRRGGTIKQRQIIFFIIFLSLALISFRLLKSLLGTP